MTTLDDAFAPDVPEGWTWEYQYNNRYLVLSWPKYGYVTMDMERRGFRGGMVWTGPLNSTDRYSGRGWKQHLTEDAVAWLRSKVRR